jgi:hypothetical protein
VQLVLPVLLVLRPLEHLVQLVLPAVGVTVPTGQAVQVVLLVADGANPGLQQAHTLMFPVVGTLQDWQAGPQPRVVMLVLLGGGKHVLSCT